MDEKGGRLSEFGPLFLYIDRVYHPLIYNLSFFNFIGPIKGQNPLLNKSGALMD